MVNAFLALELPKVWGDGKTAVADGSQIDTWADNLLAESHIRYGGYGGIAYRHIANSYIALFSRFIPCGAWEAIYIIEGLLENKSDAQPDAVHADTQGQSLPVFGLAHLCGFELLPRIRKLEGLRPVPARPGSDVFAHRRAVRRARPQRHQLDVDRDALVRPDARRAVHPGRQAVQRGAAAPAAARLAQEQAVPAFRELGRVIRTIVLLRYLSEPELRDSIAVLTNRMESFNAFCQWLQFGNPTLGDNNPDHLEKLVKFSCSPTA